MDLENFRREYIAGYLDESMLKEDPIQQFEQWLQELMALDVLDPTAMVLSTVDQSLQVHQRIVLLKSVTPEGFSFFTNQQSAKGQQIALNPAVSLHFPWHIIDRQVEIRGRAERLSDEDNDHYFAMRPRESQLAAWASPQSETIASRDALMALFQKVQQRFPNEVPRPQHWGGYCVIPHAIEFWQGGEHRLHDRIIYTLMDNQQWLIRRLSP